MRDAKDHNRLDNSLLQFKYNGAKAQFNEKLPSKNDDKSSAKPRFHDKYDKLLSIGSSKNDLQTRFNDKVFVKQFIETKNDDRNDLKARFHDKYEKIFINKNKSDNKYSKTYLSNSKSNDVKTRFDDKYDQQFIGNAKSDYTGKSGILNDVADNELKSDEIKNVCECQHGGGCVNRICLCPLGYAGERCEITLDLKVRLFYLGVLYKIY